MEEEIVEAHKCLLCGCWTCHVGSLCEECYKNVTKYNKSDSSDLKSRCKEIINRLEEMKQKLKTGR